jgi:hypothetical protein
MAPVCLNLLTDLADLPLTCFPEADPSSLGTIGDQNSSGNNVEASPLGASSN